MNRAARYVTGILFETETKLTICPVVLSLTPVNPQARPCSTNPRGQAIGTGSVAVLKLGMISCSILLGTGTDRSQRNRGKGRESAIKGKENICRKFCNGRAYGSSHSLNLQVFVHLGNVKFDWRNSFAPLRSLLEASDRRNGAKSRNGSVSTQRALLYPRFHIER